MVHCRWMACQCYFSNATWLVYYTGIFLSNFQAGAFEILDLFLTNFGPFEKIVDLQYAAGLRGPGILIKRSTIIIADLSVHAAWLRGPDISQNIQKKVKKIFKNRLPSFRYLTRHTKFWTFLGCQNSRGGNAPLAPLIKISL